MVPTPAQVVDQYNQLIVQLQEDIQIHLGGKSFRSIIPYPFGQIIIDQLYIRNCQVSILQPRILQLPPQLQKSQYNSMPTFYIQQREAWFAPLIHTGEDRGTF